METSHQGMVAAANAKLRMAGRAPKTAQVTLIALLSAEMGRSQKTRNAMTRTNLTKTDATATAR